MLVETLVNSYQNSPELSALSLNTKRTYNHYLNKVNNLIGDVTLATDSPMQKGVALQKDVALLSSVVSKFNGPQAQRMARRVLILVFAWAQEYSMLEANPAVKIPMPRLTEKARNPFTLEDVNKLEEAITNPSIPPKYLPYIKQAVVAFHTGMRPSELDNLLWEDVGPEFIQVRSAKHHEVGAVARLVKITDKVYHNLPKRTQGLVFKSLTNKPLNKDTRSDAIHYACTKVGIEPREFYSTRRGTATEMARAGYSISAIQCQLGHRDIGTTQLYIKPSMRQAASLFKGF